MARKNNLRNVFVKAKRVLKLYKHKNSFNLMENRREKSISLFSSLLTKEITIYL